MNLLVVGLSFRTAPVALLERLAVPADETAGVLHLLVGQPYVGEAVLVSTCNRVEVYAAVSGFHGGLDDICAVLAARAEVAPATLAPHLYVHYADAAVRHAFRVACGLDSMVVGEAQILGQLRTSYDAAAACDATGRLLHELMQQALRVGKRAHSETGIDRAGQSVVSAALEVAAATLADPARPAPPQDAAAGPAGVVGLAGRPALVVGAGAMGALAVATLSRVGADPIRVANRGEARAARLAESYAAHVLPYAGVGAALREVDIVVTATAAAEPVLDAPAVAAAVAARPAGAAPLVLLDLAVPRDVDPAVAALPGVRLVDIESLSHQLRGGPAAADAAAVDEIVAAEVESFLSWLRGADVAPTVAALRARADDVVSAELARLGQRRPELDEAQRAEVAHALHRVVQRLLHSPTVRVRQLAAAPGGDQYASLLRELFDLDVPHTTSAGSVPSLEGGDR
ncbi:glutamyl-tRNA reductase [Pilimelia terevasa]|uniref:Glutamyl-tRNA reductase n=1 Tax=Pilimelia terevasa TaxID=53372 RepID=A0A8J3BMM9_9ACTN|nr:glutamyl-tRNA reductase [Pilimelia terevasa]GGK30127.1 glutamyl-tRNA reductase [Pilimelia terevasa]